MPNITIGNQVIPFPDTGASPTWSPAIIDFAQAVSEALNGIASPFDISPRAQILTSDANTNLNVANVIFPNGSVLGFTFTYAIYRTNDVNSVVENGTVVGVFDAIAGSWVIEREFEGTRQTDGSVWNSFSMSGDQMQISTTAIGGSYNSTLSKISYAAKTILVSDL